MPSIHEQFPPLGTVQTISQSQDVNKDSKKKEVKKDDYDDDNGEGKEETDDEDDVYILLFGPDASGKYEPRYFDKEGYNILDLTSKKLQIKKKEKKSGQHTKQKKIESSQSVLSHPLATGRHVEPVPNAHVDSLPSAHVDALPTGDVEYEEVVDVEYEEIVDVEYPRTEDVESVPTGGDESMPTAATGDESVEKENVQEGDSGITLESQKLIIPIKLQPH